MDKSINQLRYLIGKEIKYNLKMSEYEKQAYTSDEVGIANKLHCKNQIIISLTTYGKRIYDVPLVIESLFNQTIKANKVILWLAEEEFCDDNIPVILKRMKKRGLSIGYCKDIKSYKKLIPCLLQYPFDTIITVDDDVIYARDIIERFIYSHLISPNAILFGRGHRIKFTNENKVMPYTDWEFDIRDEKISNLNFPTGIGGILYPPNSLNKNVIDETLFTRLAPSADDIWFKAMSLLNNTPVKRINMPESFWDYCTIIQRSQDISLYHTNMYQNENDKQFERTIEYYKLWDRLICKTAP